MQSEPTAKARRRPDRGDRGCTVRSFCDNGCGDLRTGVGAGFVDSLPSPRGSRSGDLVRSTAEPLV